MTISKMNILIAPKLHDTIDRGATLSCDDSGCVINHWFDSMLAIHLHNI